MQKHMLHGVNTSFKPFLWPSTACSFHLNAIKFYILFAKGASHPLNAYFIASHHCNNENLLQCVPPVCLLPHTLTFLNTNVNSAFVNWGRLEWIIWLWNDFVHWMITLDFQMKIFVLWLRIAEASPVKSLYSTFSLYFYCPSLSFSKSLWALASIHYSQEGETYQYKLIHQYVHAVPWWALFTRSYSFFFFTPLCASSSTLSILFVSPIIPGG